MLINQPKEARRILFLSLLDTLLYGSIVTIFVADIFLSQGKDNLTSVLLVGTFFVLALSLPVNNFAIQRFSPKSILAFLSVGIFLSIFAMALLDAKSNAIFIPFGIFMTCELVSRSARIALLNDLSKESAKFLDLLSMRISLRNAGFVFGGFVVSVTLGFDLFSEYYYFAIMVSVLNIIFIITLTNRKPEHPKKISFVEILSDITFVSLTLLHSVALLYISILSLGFAAFFAAFAPELLGYAGVLLTLNASLFFLIHTRVDAFLRMQFTTKTIFQITAPAILLIHMLLYMTWEKGLFVWVAYVVLLTIIESSLVSTFTRLSVAFAHADNRVPYMNLFNFGYDIQKLVGGAFVLYLVPLIGPLVWPVLGISISLPCVIVLLFFHTKTQTTQSIKHAW